MRWCHTNIAFFIFHLVYYDVDGSQVSDVQRPWLGSICPSYKDYSSRVHPPYSTGALALPFQRPHPNCRTFQSEAVESTINKVTEMLVDKDLARLFENTFPNTLDTTIRWHDPKAPASFIITGDIDAQWLRDSTFQLEAYHSLLKRDTKLRILVLGAIMTQASFVEQSPYWYWCNRI